MIGRKGWVRPSTTIELEWKPVTFCLSDELENGHPLWKANPSSLTWDCTAYPSVEGNGWELKMADQRISVQTEPTTFKTIFGDITLSDLKVIFPDDPSNDEAIEGLRNILMELA